MAVQLTPEQVAVALGIAASSGDAPGPTPPAPGDKITVADLAADVLARIAPALAGGGGKYLAVIADASGLELVNAPSGDKPVGGWTATDLAQSVVELLLPDFASVADGQVVGLESGAPTWITPPSGNVPSFRTRDANEVLAINNAGSRNIWTKVGVANLAGAVLARIAPALSGEGGKYLAVKADASAVELVNAPTGTKPAGGWTLDDLATAVLARMAPALTGNGGKFLAVNSGATAVELVDKPSGGGAGAPVKVATFAPGGGHATVAGVADACRPGGGYRFVQLVGREPGRNNKHCPPFLTAAIPASGAFVLDVTYPFQNGPARAGFDVNASGQVAMYNNQAGFSWASNSNIDVWGIP